MHGESYYVGAKEWLSGIDGHLTFLTTEAFVTEVIERALRLHRRSPIRLDLTNLPDVYPIKVPVRFDKRAAKKGSSALAPIPLT